MTFAPRLLLLRLLAVAFVFPAYLEYSIFLCVLRQSRDAYKADVAVILLS